MNAAEIRIGEWNGHTNYGCPHCPFATLDESKLLEHVFDAHRFMEQPKPVSAALFDPNGKLISTEDRN